MKEQVVSSLRDDLKVLWHLVSWRRAKDHRTSLENFYEPQADLYDGFRERLLHGRQEMLNTLIPEGFDGVWVDIGGGTARNVEYVYRKLAPSATVFVVDLCDSLLKKAQQRVLRLGWSNVTPVHGDGTSYALPPSHGKAQIVTFSYSLTMIPDWEAALRNAKQLLEPGGRIGIVDFYTEHAQQNQPALGTFQRNFWPWWFRKDSVYLNAMHQKCLREEFVEREFRVSAGKVPYLLGLTAPYYFFIGSQRASVP